MFGVLTQTTRWSTRSLFAVYRSPSSSRPASSMPQVQVHTVDTSDRLAVLRRLMASTEHNLQAYVVPTEDEHSSEYIAAADKRRAFISGFTGSAGCAIITPNDAYLFTDGRYFLQAEQQLDKNWTLMKTGLPDVLSWQEFLSKNLPTNTRIGVDPTVITASDAETISKALVSVASAASTDTTPVESSSILPISENLVDAVWPNRPARTHNPILHLSEKFAGKSSADKIKAIREDLEKNKRTALVVTMLDEIAWLFNLRGSDIEYNPVFFAYAVVTPTAVELFVSKSQLDDAALAYVQNIANVHPYEAFFDYLKQLPAGLTLNAESKILLGSSVSLAVANALGKDTYVIAPSPVAALKAIKNNVECEGFRQSHIRDGAALARYFSWLEEALGKSEEVDECRGADALEGFRKELDFFQGLSFDTISGAGPNAAIIHYKPNPADCAIIKKDQIYLCDSGAQFLDGTTDVTRTWHFGTPTSEEKRAFTRVLQGHIAIDTAVFPNGTTGYVIDSWARRALWQDGLDYRHGTGHGVGHFLNVHEGPQGIGVRIAYNSTPLKTGMTVSNEPGYYADGKFGIRIESIVLVREVGTPNNFGDKGYLGFEHVTLCPIQKNLVDVELLTVAEKKWLNDYHAETWQKVSPLLKDDARALKWLERECEPL